MAQRELQQAKPRAASRLADAKPRAHQFRPLGQLAGRVPRVFDEIR